MGCLKSLWVSARGTMRCNVASSFVFFFLPFSHLLGPSWSQLALTGLLGHPLYSYINIHTYICIHVCVCVYAHISSCHGPAAAVEPECQTPPYSEVSEIYWKQWALHQKFLSACYKIFVPKVVKLYPLTITTYDNSLISPNPATNPMEWCFRAWSSSPSQPRLYQVSSFKSLSPELRLFRVPRLTFLRFSEELPSNAATQIKGNSGVIQIFLIEDRSSLHIL